MDDHGASAAEATEATEAGPAQGSLLGSLSAVTVGQGEESRTLLVLSMTLTVDSYPTTPETQRALVVEHGADLVNAWLDRGLPRDQLHCMVCPPGAMSPTEAHRIHCVDQAAALARDTGCVAVVMTMATAPFIPEMVVSRVRFD